MQTLTINMPQTLRVHLQAYQNDNDIETPDKALISALEDYFQTWQPTKTSDALPTMYDAEDGPCEVIDSFLDGPASTCC